MGLFKSAEQKRMEEQMQIKRGISRIKAFITKSEESKKNYILEAKRAKLYGLTAQYRQARSAISMVMSYVRIAERLLLTMEMSEQMRDSAAAVEQFTSGTEILSRQISDINGKLNFVKTNQRMNKAMTDMSSMQENSGQLLDESNTMYSEFAGNEMDKEIDSLIEREMMSDESSLDAKMDAEIQSLLKKKKGEI